MYRQPLYVKLFTDYALLTTQCMFFFSSEDKLAVASVMVDTMMEVVIHQLENSVLKLVSVPSFKPQ